MSIIFFDSETIGYSGPIILLQWAEGDGEVHLDLLWHKTVKENLELLDKIIYNPDGVVAFNISFDWFHVAQFYTTLKVLESKLSKDDYESKELQDLILEYAFAEKEGRNKDICIKPTKACDVMLVARKGVYQSTMDRKAIKIKRIPTVLADKLTEELEKRIALKDIYFARRKDKHAKKWKVWDIIKNKGQPDETIDPYFKNIVLKFHSSSALKTLAADALNLNVNEVLKYKDVEVDSKYMPEELGYAPYALADPLTEESVKEGNGWRKTWPQYIRIHIKHWHSNTGARVYATNDVIYLRDLYKYFNNPELGDDDSELACMVGVCKWRGFHVDIEQLKRLKADNIVKIGQTPTTPRKARIYLEEVLSEDEKIVMDGSTKKIILQNLTKFKTDCPVCITGEKKEKALSIVCPKCEGKGIVEHPVAKRAKAILDARIAQYENNLFDKLILAGRGHFDFKVIGALSSRMSGGGETQLESVGRQSKGSGLNPQGIPRKKGIRKAFTLISDRHKNNFTLCGGDFDAFEVTLADAAYNDEQLRKELLTCGNCNHVCSVSEYQDTFCPKCRKCGNTKCNYVLTEEEYNNNKVICPKCGEKESTRKKIHGIFATQLFPDKTYQQILDSKGSSYDMYDLGKRGVFSTIYGGDQNTIKEKLGIDLEIAEAAYQRWISRFNGVGIAQRRVFDSFCSMRQEAGIGTQVHWHNPADYMESLFGFRRYFILENQICKALFDLANRPPKDWRMINVKVVRRERMQTVSGAIQSALYGAAFQIQAAAMRAAKNHEIQSSGATITKHVQRKVWGLQPSGINPWIVQPMNIHDELLCVTRKGYESQLEKTVYETVETFRSRVPLIKIQWKTGMESWASK